MYDGFDFSIGEKMDIENVALLARLNLSDEEKNKFQEQMGSILEYFEDLNEVNTDGVVPLVTPTEIVNEFRQDEPVHWQEAETALNIAPDIKGNLYKVPPVV